jgi:hypothetical protein
MVRVDVHVAPRRDLEVDHAVPRHLVEHVFKERHPGSEPPLPRAVEVQTHAYLGFQRVSGYLCLPHDDRRLVIVPVPAKRPARIVRHSRMIPLDAAQARKHVTRRMDARTVIVAQTGKKRSDSVGKDVHGKDKIAGNVLL